MNIFRYFPSQGERVYVFVTEMEMPEELPKMSQVMEKLKSQVPIPNDIFIFVSTTKAIHTYICLVLG